MANKRRARGKRKPPRLRKPVPAALTREPPVIADTATSAPLTFRGEPIVFDNDPPPITYPALAIPPDVPRESSEADERIAIGADLWVDRHPALTISAVALIGVSLFASVVYGVLQLGEYAARWLESVNG